MPMIRQYVCMCVHLCVCFYTSVYGCTHTKNTNTFFSSFLDPMKIQSETKMGKYSLGNTEADLSLQGLCSEPFSIFQKIRLTF